MRIDIQGQGFQLTAPLLDYTEQRLRFALTRTSARIKRAVVRLGNTNRPRGGADKFCSMQVYLEHASPVMIEDSGADLHAVIDRVTERAGRIVTTNVDRLREKFRLGRLQPPASLPGDAFDVSKPRTEGV